MQPMPIPSPDCAEPAPTGCTAIKACIDPVTGKPIPLPVEFAGSVNIGTLNVSSTGAVSIERCSASGPVDIFYTSDGNPPVNGVVTLIPTGWVGSAGGAQQPMSSLPALVPCTEEAVVPVVMHDVVNGVCTEFVRWFSSSTQTVVKDVDILGAAFTASASAAVGPCSSVPSRICTTCPP